jgi:hypothetical protein
MNNRNNPEIIITAVLPRRTLAALALLMLTPLGPSPAVAEDGLGFAHKVCDLYEAPIEHATFAAGAGCTWLIGDGDVGTTRTEIVMTANRNAGAEVIALMTASMDEAFENMRPVPGYRSRIFDLNCDGGSPSAKMVFWGMPSKSNITGYAICGNHILFGEIHTPPNSDLDTEMLFEKLMRAMMPMLIERK